MSNIIDILHKRIVSDGITTLSLGEFYELQKQWVSRCLGENVLNNLQKQLDYADKIAGEAQRKINIYEKSSITQNDWLRKAKTDAGYSENTSFDVVWQDALAALNKIREQK